MKKKLTRILAALLIAMMLIPTLATFAVNAEGETGETGETGEAGETTETIDISDIVNVYELNKLNAAPNTEKVADAKDKEPTEEEGVLASKAFEVTAPNNTSYIYVGPCPDPRLNDGKDLDYIAYWYKPTGAYTGQKKFAELGNGDATAGYANIYDEFEDGSVILKIKIKKQSNPLKNTDHKYAALKLPANSYSNYILATCNRPFTVEEYYAYADAQGWALDGTGLRPAAPEYAEEAPEGYDGLWNYFPLEEGFVAPTTQKEATNKYKISKYIPVAKGDIVRIGAVSTKETHHIIYAYSDEKIPGENTEGPVVYEYKETQKYKKGDYGVDFVENIGYDCAIHSYTVPEGVSFIKVVAPESLYGSGDILVTKNQPFNATSLRTALDIPELSAQAKAHDFYGKTALFVGDSILYGEYDTPNSFRSPYTSFARRFALATGLIPTVYSANGATIGKVVGKPNIKQTSDLIRTLSAKKQYDMVIFQGGINDARQGLAVGEILSVDTAREILAEPERLETFAGGLQLMFYDALNKWTEAEFYYIADYKVTSDAVNGKDMSTYYAQAKALCEIYGIHYIDLYGDTALYTSFDYNNAELFADDKFTPLASTYDLLFPTLLSLFDKSLSEELTNPFAGTDELAPPPVAEPEGLDIGIIIAIVAAGVVVLAGGGFALYWFVIRKKKVAKPANVEAEAPASEPEATTTEESTSDEVKKDE